MRKNTRRKTWFVAIALLLVLALGLAACGGEDDDNEPETSATTGDESGTGDADDAEANDSGGFNPGGTGITLGGAADSPLSNLPGCSDPDDEECPAALSMVLDGEAEADGLAIQYPARYFNALTGDEAGDALIRIEPSENNRYAEEAFFELYEAESVDAALDGLVEPESAEWSTDILTGTIAVSKDQTQEPPVNTTIGAFEAPDGRVLVLELTTTGKYGWDLWSVVYADMLDTITVEVE